MNRALRSTAAVSAAFCLAALGSTAPTARADDGGVTLVVPSDATVSKRDKVDMVTYHEVYNKHDKFEYHIPRVCTIKYSTPPKNAEPLPAAGANWISVQCPPGYGFKSIDVDYKWSYDPQDGAVVSEVTSDNVPADGRPHKTAVRFGPMHPGPTGSLGLHAKLTVTPIMGG